MTDEDPVAPGSAFRSASVVLWSRVFVQGLSLAKGIVVARLLAPDELGAFFLVVAVVGALEISSHPGFEDALVNSTDERPRLWQATWTALIIRGAVVSVLLGALASPICSWLEAPELTPLLLVLSLTPLLRGLSSLSPVWSTRNVDLRPAVTAEVLASLVDTVAGVALVAATGSAWGLVVAMLLGTAARAAWSYRYSGFVPRLVFSWAEIRPLFRFGRWRFLSNVLYYTTTRADDLLVGRYLGRSSVGNYRIAYRLANLPTTEIVSVIQRVGFPALARLRRRSSEDARRADQRYLLLTCGVVGPLAAVMAALARPLVAALLGASYAAAAAPLAIMCLAGYLRAVVSTAGALYLGFGRPELDVAIDLARAVVLVVGVILLSTHGIVGAASASLLSLVVALPAWLMTLPAVGVRPLQAVATMLRRTPETLTAGLAAWAVATLIPAGPPLLAVGGACAGLAAWGLGIAAFDRALGRELLSLARRVRRTSVTA